MLKQGIDSVQRKHVLIIWLANNGAIQRPSSIRCIAPFVVYWAQLPEASLLLGDFLYSLARRHRVEHGSNIGDVHRAVAVHVALLHDELHCSWLRPVVVRGRGIDGERKDKVFVGHAICVGVADVSSD